MSNVLNGKRHDTSEDMIDLDAGWLHKDPIFMDAPQTQPPVFHSIAFPSQVHEAAAQPRADWRDVFHDLFLDQIFDAAYGGFARKEQTTPYTVLQDPAEPDYSAAIARAFARARCAIAARNSRSPRGSITSRG